MVACPSVRHYTNILLIISSILQISILLYFDAGVRGQRESAIGPDVFSSPSTTPRRREITVDILSIGSQNRLDYIDTQKSTFGLHRSVRNFFSVTEKDDFDPMCASKLTISDVAEISTFCRAKAKWNPRRQFLMTYLKSAYVSTESIVKLLRGESQSPMERQTIPYRLTALIMCVAA